MENTDREGNQDKRQGTFQEEFKVTGDRVIGTIKELIREGNVRRIIIKNEQGRTLLEFPLTVGVVGTVLLPVWAAIGAVAALVANLTIAVERRGPPASAGNGNGGEPPAVPNE
jgi:hypothetical protein